MNRKEKEAKQKLAHHGIITTTNGSVAGNLKHPADWETAPTTTLKHGFISRLTGRPPKEVR